MGSFITVLTEIFGGLFGNTGFIFAIVGVLAVLLGFGGVKLYGWISSFFS